MRPSLLKKGFDITAEAWKVLIPAIIVMIVMLFIVRNIQSGAEENADNIACKASVIANSHARIANFAGGDWSSEIKCPMQKITIDSGDDEEIKKQTAEAMYTCWDNFGKGKLNIFPTELGADEVFCALCSEITYEQTGKNIVSFMEYTVANNPVGSKLSYFEEFTGRSPTDDEITRTSSSNIGGIDDYIDSDQKYVVVFTYSKSVGFFDKIFGFTRPFQFSSATMNFFSEASKAGASFIGLPSVASTTAFYGFLPIFDSTINWQAGIHLLPIETGAIETDIADSQSLLSQLHCTKLGVKLQ